MLMSDPQWAAVRQTGRVDGRWLRTVDVPTARAFTRGYDRDATDGLLEECAETIEELTYQLQLAHDEVVELRRQARTRAARRGRTRVRSRQSGHARRRRVRVRRAVRG
jgi:hypothetical protein